jgi:hypothetical protein
MKAHRLIHEAHGSIHAFTGMAIDFCDGARVTLKVTATSGCAGYELHFHD